MPDSPILGIPQVAPNQNNKETTINDGISIIERSLNDVHVLTTGVNATISAADFRRHQVLQIVPTAGSLVISVPVQKRFFAVYNASGTHAFTLRRVGDVSGGITVATGSYIICYQNGTNPILLIADSAAASFASTFITLSDAPTTYTGQALKLARVNAAENALEFWTLDQSVLQLNDTPNSYTPLQYLRVNAAGTAFEYVSANPGGETEFILLTDVPLNYDDAAGFFVKVNATEDGLEFVDGAGLFDFTDLGDVPSSYAGQAGQLVAVNPTSNGLEFVDFPSFGAQVTLTLTTSNDGFEAAILTPWEADDEADLAFYDVSATVGAFGPGAGSYSLVVDADVLSTAINCTYDLLLYADAASLDNSARITVPYMFIDTLSNGTTGLVEVECLSAVDAVLSTLTSGTITGAGVWSTGSVVGIIPSGTRKIRIRLTTTGDGDPLLAGWDGFVCQLRITESVSFIDLPDTPAAYTGHEGKVPKVNGDEDGLEFAFVTAVQITGMPSSLTGEGGKVLQVNPGGTAYVLTELFPAYDIGEALGFLRVNAGGTALEWVAGGGGGVTDGDKTDIVVSSAGTVWTIDAGVVSNVKMSPMASGTFKARSAAGSGDPQDLTGAQATALLDDFVGSGAGHKKGLVPTPGASAGTVKVLCEDGTWKAPGYDLGVFIGGRPDNAELVCRIQTPRPFSLPVSLTGSYGSAQVASTGTVSFDLLKNGVSFGTLTFTASGTGVFTAASATTFAAGDVITIVAPATADPTLENISINLNGSAL